MNVFNQYARYYDLLYQDKDYRGEVAFVKHLLERHASHAKMLLELGCGSGSHAVSLAEMGYVLLGIDQSEDMLALAREKSQKLTPALANRLSWRRRDICRLELTEQYDSIISLFHVMNYQTQDKDIISVFETANKHLNHHGLFIFDCWHGPAVLHQKPEIRVKRAENSDVFITRLCEPQLLPEQNIVNVHYTFFVENKKNKEIKSFRETHRMRYLFSHEIENFAEKTDLSIIETKEWMTGNAPSNDSFSVYYVLKKNPPICRE